MHAGEALWNLYALLTFIERKNSSNPAMLKITASGLESCKTLGEFINVGAPDAASLQTLVDGYERLQAVEMKPTRDPSRSVGREVTSGPAKEAIALCDSMLEDMDDLPDAAADFREGIEPKVTHMREWIESKNHVTEKMMSSLQNMRGGMDRWLHRE